MRFLRSGETMWAANSRRSGDVSAQESADRRTLKCTTPKAACKQAVTGPRNAFFYKGVQEFLQSLQRSTRGWSERKTQFFRRLTSLFLCQGACTSHGERTDWGQRCSTVKEWNKYTATTHFPSVQNKGRKRLNSWDSHFFVDHGVCPFPCSNSFCLSNMYSRSWDFAGPCTTRHKLNLLLWLRQFRLTSGDLGRFR